MAKYELHRVEKNFHLVNEKTDTRCPSSLGIQSRHRTREAAEKAKTKLLAPRVEKSTGEKRWPLYDWDLEIAETVRGGGLRWPRYESDEREHAETLAGFGLQVGA